jgi:hypothetical protein
MKRIALLFIMVGLLLMDGAWQTRPAQARPHATYDLVKSSIGSGGSGSAGIYTISSSIGQPDAGEVSVGNYTLGGGFWGGGVIVSAVGSYQIYLPLIQR